MVKGVHLHTFYGDDNGREAKVYLVKNTYYEVDFIKMEKVIKTRKMITNEGLLGEVIHSEQYAEDAAENWCMGYME
tara:strand:+ start:240 stop:467 length:228 start_codon:yes stop_codon:yes gene_type:complete